MKISKDSVLKIANNTCKQLKKQIQGEIHPVKDGTEFKITA